MTSIPLTVTMTTTIAEEMITCEIGFLIKNHFVRKKTDIVTEHVKSKKHWTRKKITVVTDFLFLSGMTLAGSWLVVGGAHIQALALFMVLELSRPRSVA